MPWHDWTLWQQVLVVLCLPLGFSWALYSSRYDVSWHSAEVRQGSKKRIDKGNGAC